MYSRKRALAETKALARPPKEVANALAIVLSLMQGCTEMKKQPSWHDCQKAIENPAQFLQQFDHFEPRPDQLPLIANCARDYPVDLLKTKALAAAELAQSIFEKGQQVAGKEGKSLGEFCTGKARAEIEEESKQQQQTA